MSGKIWLSLSLLVFGVMSCSDSSPPERIASSSGAGSATVKKCFPLVAVQSWQGGIDAIFETNCGSCHPGTRSTDYTSYGGVTGNISTELSRIDSNSMPPTGGMTQSDKDAVHAWATAGMPETDSEISTANSQNSSTNSGCIPSPSPQPTPSSTVSGDTSKQGSATVPAVPSQPAGTVLSWDGGINTIFVDKCGSCHNGSAQASIYDTFAGVSGNITVEQLRISAGTMPPSGALAASDQQLIGAWINAGMPQTDSQIPTKPVPPLPPPSLVPTYSGGVKTIMAASCTGCHSSTASNGRTSPYLDTLNGVKSNFSSVMNAVNSGSMPRGTSQLPADQILVLKNWGSAPNSPYGQWAP